MTSGARVCSVSCRGLVFDLPQELKVRLSSLLLAAGQGCMALHEHTDEGRDARDLPLDGE